MIHSDLDPRSSEKSVRNPKILNREVFYRGQDIIHQGDEGYRAYYIESGRVEVYLKDGEHQLKLTELGPGDIFGEMALINHEARTASVRALDECVLTVISREEIDGKIDRIKDKAIRALINVLAARLRETSRGQMLQYKSLAEFQDRVTGMVDKAHAGVSSEKRDAFRLEVEPLLADLQDVLDRYQK